MTLVLVLCYTVREGVQITEVFCVFPENATDAEINSTRVEMERIGVCPVILTKRG